MDTCHCEYESIPVHSDDVPWARQSLGLRRLVTLLIKPFLPCPDHSQHFLPREVYLSYSVVLGVANIDEVLVFSEHVAQAKRVVELHLAVRAIDETHLSISDLTFELHGFFIYEDKAVIA